MTYDVLRTTHHLLYAVLYESIRYYAMSYYTIRYQCNVMIHQRDKHFDTCHRLVFGSRNVKYFDLLSGPGVNQFTVKSDGMNHRPRMDIATYNTLFKAIRCGIFEMYSAHLGCKSAEQ